MTSNLLDNIYNYIINNQKLSSKIDTLYQTNRIDAEEEIEEQIKQYLKYNKKTNFNINLKDLSNEEIEKFTDEIFYRTRL